MLCCALALSGCLSSGYTYLSHRNPDDTEVYFKLPTTWSTFDNAQLIDAVNGKLSSSQISQIAGAQWLVAFTAEPHAVAKSAGTIGNRYPGGYTFSEQLSETERDSLSFSTMRSVILGTDPLTATTGSPYDVLSYTETVWPGGIRTNELEVDINQSDGPTLTFGQIVAVDPQTNWIMAIGIGCRASCWGPNQGLIKQVLKSWQVKEVGR
jgi:hypothetical protein